MLPGIHILENFQSPQGMPSVCWTVRTNGSIIKRKTASIFFSFSYRTTMVSHRKFLTLLVMPGSISVLVLWHPDLVEGRRAYLMRSNVYLSRATREIFHSPYCNFWLPGICLGPLILFLTCLIFWGCPYENGGQEIIEVWNLSKHFQLTMTRPYPCPRTNSSAASSHGYFNNQVLTFLWSLGSV